MVDVSSIFPPTPESFTILQISFITSLTFPIFISKDGSFVIRSAKSFGIAVTGANCFAAKSDKTNSGDSCI